MARKSEGWTGWADIFRAFTVLCAMLYLLAQYTAGVSGQASVDGVCALYEKLTIWAFPALFMLWGMTALDEGRFSRVGGSALGLLLPCFVTLVVWSALYAVLGVVLGGGSVTWAGVWHALKSAALGSTRAHLEILYPLLGLYLVTPVVGRFVSAAGRGEVVYFLLLCFLFASVLPVWSALTGNAVIRLLERLGVHLVLGYVGYYVAGWYLRRYTIGRVSELFIYLFGLLGVGLTFFGSRFLGGSAGLWAIWTAPGVALTALAMCTLFRYLLGVSEERSRRASVKSLGGFSFGIYLFHQVVLMVFLRLFGNGPLLAFPALTLPLFALLFFLLSAPFAWLLWRIPVAGRYLT